VKQVIMAITGASGTPYARRLASCIAKADAHLHLIISPHGAYVLKDELELPDVTPETLLGGDARNVTLYRHKDQTARIASGSFLTDGMVICPCSSHTLAGIAAGTAENLVTRAAMVTLKEARQLILVPREMPLSQIEIANMLRVSQAGGIICPACPGFYAKPKSIDDLLDFVVARVLDLLGLEHDLDVRWTPPADTLNME
jgi:4-hydroxy-3-polyprenylbenzoate decarboxylase